MRKLRYTCRRQFLLLAASVVAAGCGGRQPRPETSRRAQARLTIYWGAPQRGASRFIPLNANLILVTVRDHLGNELASKRAVRESVASDTVTFSDLPSGEVVFEALSFEVADPQTDTPSRTSALSGSGEKVVRLYSGSDNAVALVMNSLTDSIHISQGAVESSEFTVKVGTSVTLSAVRYQGGFPQPGGAFAWEISDSSVASVDASGNVRGLKIGEAILTVREQGNSGGGMSGTARVVVSLFSTSTPQYTVIEIPKLPGYDASDAIYVLGMNDLGQVVGYCWGTWKPYKGFVWDASSGIREISINSKVFRPKAINNRGQICGNYTFDDAHEHPVILNPDGSYVDLYQTSNIGYNSFAYSMNENGVVVGTVYLGNRNGNYAIMWSQDGTSFRRCNPVGSPTSVFGDEIARDINDENEVIGYSNSTDGIINQGFLFDSGKYNILDVGNFVFTEAYSINNKSTVVGEVRSSGNRIRKAAVWELGKPVRILPTILDSANSAYQAFDINDYGDVVGWDGEKAVLWRGSGEVIHLDSMVSSSSAWSYSFANKTNNAGQVLLSGDMPGQKFVYLLVPR